GREGLEKSWFDRQYGRCQRGGIERSGYLNLDAIGGQIGRRRVLAGGRDGAGTTVGVAAGDRPGDVCSFVGGERGLELLDRCAARAGCITTGAVGVNRGSAWGNGESSVRRVGSDASASASGHEKHDRCSQNG